MIPKKIYIYIWKQIISARFENRKLVQKINTTPTQTKQAPSF